MDWPEVFDLSLYFRALADRKRLKIAQYLAQHDEVTVTELGAELRLSQPLISWHLRMLRRAGIVKTRRAGRLVFCSLNRAALIRYQERASEVFALDSASTKPDTTSQRVLKAAR